MDKVVDKSVDGMGSRRTAADLSSLARTAAGEGGWEGPIAGHLVGHARDVRSMFLAL